LSRGATSYRLYGLTVNSTVGLPGPRANGGKPDIVFRRAGAGQVAAWRRIVSLDRTRRDWFRHRILPDGSRYLLWTDLFEFHVSADGGTIHHRRLRRGTEESFRTYLLGQVLSFSLLALGLEPLHGTVMVIDGSAVAFLGDTGFGKSTLGAAFLRLGFPILTDDLLVLRERRGRFLAAPGVPRIKLFPRPARVLLGRKGAGPRMNPGTTKLVLPLARTESAPDEMPLRAIYLLSKPGRPQPRRISIEPVAPANAFFDVIANSFNGMVRGRPRLERQFAFASRVAGAIPFKRLAYPRSLELLPAVCEAVLSDLDG
jgi:hypothetical protein